MNNTQILVGVIILLVIILIVINKKAEHLDAPNLSNEAIQNISSVYANTTGQAVFNNIKVTGNADFRNFKGIIVMWSGTNVPSGWTLCDGTNGTPDLRGRFVLGSGKGENLTERKINDKGGAEEHKLIIEEMPSHTHSPLYAPLKNNGKDIGLNDLTNNDKISYHVRSFKGTGGDDRTIIRDNGSNSGEVYIPYVGGDKTITTVSGYNENKPQTWATKPHNNMPPFYVLAYIMKL